MLQIPLPDEKKLFFLNFTDPSWNYLA